MHGIGGIREIFAFRSTFIENLHVLPDGNLLLSTRDSPGLLYMIDPEAVKPIDEQGKKAGEIEVIARSPSPKEIYDDFAFDSAGNAYVAVHSSSLFRITPDGKQTLLAGGIESPFFQQPTSVALANDEKSIYVSTGGEFAGDPITGGQVVQVWL